jgi:hypothetical protein
MLRVYLRCSCEIMLHVCVSYINLPVCKHMCAYTRMHARIRILPGVCDFMLVVCVAMRVRVYVFLLHVCIYWLFKT